MRSLQEALGRELLWRPRSLLSRTHDLVEAGPQLAGTPGEGEPFATLVWRPGFMMGGPAEARAAEGHWRFRRRGFFRERVLVLGDDDAVLAVFQRHWRRGVLRFEDGREYSWRRGSLLSTTWRFEDPGGTPVARFRGRFSFPRGTTRVEIDSSAATISDRALLACLGWYLLLLARRKAARGGG